MAACPYPVVCCRWNGTIRYLATTIAVPAKVQVIIPRLRTILIVVVSFMIGATARVFRERMW
jgi:hypothetical protein